MPFPPVHLALLLLTAQGPAGPDSIVWQAARAATPDGSTAVTRNWLVRLDADPEDAAALLGLAAFDFYRYRYDESLARYRQLAATPTDAWSVRGWLGIGHVLHRRAELAAADSAYDRAAIGATAIGDSAAVADALINLAMVRARTRGPDVAAVLFDSAARVLAGANDRQRALHRCARGLVFIETGPGRDATTASLLEGERIARAAEEPALAASCVFGRAAVHMALGDSDSVFALLDQAIELQRSAGDSYGLAGVLQRRSWYQRAVGSYATARATLAESLHHAALSGNASVEAWASIDLANIALAVRDYVQTAAHVTRAEQLFEHQNDRWGLATAATIRARMDLAAGDIDAARTEFEAALRRQLVAGDRLAAIGSYSILSAVAMLEGQLDRAAELLAEARTQAESGGLTGWERGLEAHEARLALERGNFAQAREILVRLLAAPHQAVRRYELHVMMAQVRVAHGDLAGAETEMQEAGIALDNWRMSLDDRQFRIQAFQPQEVSHGAANVIAALVEGGRLDGAFRIAEQRRARELYDRMVIARTIEAVETGPARRPVPVPDLAGWRASAGARTALVYYVTGEAQPTSLLLITQDTAVGRVLAPIDSMASTIERFRALAESGADLRSVGAQVAERVTGGALDDPILEQVDKLVIVPDGPLHRLPFASLVLDDGRYAVERYAITAVPSAAVALQLAGARGRGGPARLLALGDPEFEGDVTVESAFRPGTDSGRALPRLAASGREARRIARFAAEADVRTGSDASEAWLRSASLEGYDIIHFATHALVDEQALARSALALSPGQGEDGYVGSGELSGLDLQADLLVLSACRSAGGVVLRGEGIHGLTAPLLEAGARSILATQWQIEDAAVLPFVEDFYGALADGLDVAAALQSAQLSSMRRGEPGALWAGFTLVGNPDVTLVLHRPSPVSPLTLTAIIALLGGLAVAMRQIRNDVPYGALATSSDTRQDGD